MLHANEQSVWEWLIMFVIALRLIPNPNSDESGSDVWESNAKYRSTYLLICCIKTEEMGEKKKPNAIVLFWYYLCSLICCFCAVISSVILNLICFNLPTFIFHTCYGPFHTVWSITTMFRILTDLSLNSSCGSLRKSYISSHPSEFIHRVLIVCYLGQQESAQIHITDQNLHSNTANYFLCLEGKVLRKVWETGPFYSPDGVPKSVGPCPLHHITMNISLENPYGSVTIPRAHLRTSDDDSTVIINPMALDPSNSANPYSAETKNGTQNPPPYGGEGGYTVKEDDEEVGRCNACCRSCRRKWSEGDLRVSSPFGNNGWPVDGGLGQCHHSLPWQKEAHEYDHPQWQVTGKNCIYIRTKWEYVPHVMTFSQAIFL